MESKRNVSDKNAENYEEMDEEEEDESSDESSQVTDMINEDLTTEERQAEFIALMKERFVDGKDPDHDYEDAHADAYDENADDDMTAEWFDDEEEDIVKREPSETATNEDEDEEDYMTMDLTQFAKS